MALDIEKSRARLQAKQRRAEAHNPAAATKLIQHFPASRFRGQIIGGYWPLPGELDCRPLLIALADQGERLGLPCTLRKGHPLTFRAWHPKDTLKAGPYNTREPYPDKAEVIPAVVLVPLLAFTTTGERLGYGGGFYDRTLAKLKTQSSVKKGPVWACGIAYDGQEAHTLPVGPYDIRLDAVLTESGLREFTAQ